MARITITVEDRDDGAVLMTSDAEMGDLTQKAMGERDLSPAEYLAVSAWHALHNAVKEAAAKHGAQVAAWDDQRTVN